jgi:FKBP-type peptidyl-prolyl cis-trans isomerase
MTEPELPNHEHDHNHSHSHAHPDHDCHCDHDHDHHHHHNNDDDDSSSENENEKLSVVPKVLEDGRVDCNPGDPLKVVKTIVKEGSGDTPISGFNVNVHYVGTLENGTKFDSSRDRDQPVSFFFCVCDVFSFLFN